MRKRFIMLMLGMAVCASVLTGCGSTKEDADVPEVLEEETAQPESGEEALPETAAAPEAGSDVDGSQEEEDMSVPVRIWGTILSVSDTEIFVDNQSDASSSGEISLNIDWSQNRVLDARTGYPVQSEEVETGSFEAYLGPVMTLSLPPQTSPSLVIVNIPEDFRAPQYAVVEEISEEEDQMLVLTATDGRTYRIPSDAEVSPFLTKNIVTLDDMEAGTECLLWLTEEDTAEKIVLFGK